MRIFSQHERRLGLLTVRRRRLTAAGSQPVGPGQHVFAWCSVSGAVAPTTGERFLLELPYRTADLFQMLRDACAQASPDSLHRLLLDHGGAPTAQRLHWPDNLRCRWLPPDGPELNPIERARRDRKANLAWGQFPALAAQLAYVGE